MKASQLKGELVKSIKAGLPIFIKGAPGIGKSDIIAQVAKELEADLLINHPVVSDPTDFKGLPGVVNNKAEFLPFGDLRKLIEAKKLTICFLDDLGQAPAVVQAAAMQLLLNRSVNGHKVSDHVVFVAATNRREDMAGVTCILEPVKSRFASIVELTVDVDDWIEWAMNNEIRPEVIGFIHFRPELLNKGEATRDIVNHPCPRTIVFLSKLIDAGITSIEMYSGAIGQGAAAEFSGFLRIYKELPNINEILMEPETAPVPEQPASLYAVVAALVNRLSSKNAQNIMIYAERLPADFSVLLIKDCIRKDSSIITKTKQFSLWAKNHKDILL